MKRPLKFLCIGILSAVSALVASMSAQTTGPVIDLSANGQTLSDAVTGSSYASGGVIATEGTAAGAASSFQVSAGRISPNGSGGIVIAPPANPFAHGFTVAVSLAPISGTVENVFSLNDSSGMLLFNVLRDNQGRWYVGKRRDNDGSAANIYYIAKTWDPVSPCVGSVACQSDTLYVSFQLNGQINLDEVSVLKSGNLPDTYAWHSGLLNFGYPMSGYNTNPSLTADLTLPLQQMALGRVQLQPQSASTFNSPALLGQTSYPAANIYRIALWSYPLTIGTDNTSPSNQIMQDQASKVGPLYNLYPQPNWINCDSGQFEQPAGQFNTTNAQYWPDQIPTPCNVPSAPQNVQLQTVNGSVVASWTAPAFLGTADYNVSTAITDYYLTFNIDGGSISSCRGSDGTTYTASPATAPIIVSSSVSSCAIPLPSNPVSVSIAAKGIGGSTVPIYTLTSSGATKSVPLVVGLSPFVTAQMASSVSAPTNLTASSIRNTGFTLQWTDPNNLSGRTPAYTVMVDGAPVTCASAAQPACIVSNVYSGYEHSVEVGETLNGVSSDTATITVTTTVAPLTNFSATHITTNSATLTFTDSNIWASTPSYVTSWLVCVPGPNGSCAGHISQSTSSSTTTLQMTGLQASKTYNQVIYAEIDGVDPSPMISGSFTTHIWYALTVSSITPEADALLVSFTDPNTYTSADSTPAYTLKATLANGSILTATCAASPCNFTGLDAEATYSVVADTTSDGVTSPDSNAVAAQTGEYSLSSLSVSNINSTGSTLSWSDPNIYAAGVTPTYTVSYGAIGNPASSTSLTTSTTSATLTGLSLYTQYAASVTVSVGGSGSPAFTPVVAFTTLPGTFVPQTLCATQNAVCNASGTNLISYGNYGSYVYVPETGSFSCTNSIAGFDPLPGTNKACYFVPSVPAGPVGFTGFCGPEGTTCFIQSQAQAVVAFGGGSKWVYALVNGSAPCAPVTFANMDPNPGTNESCFYSTNILTTAPQNLNVSTSMGSTGGVNMPNISASWSAPSTGVAAGTTYTLSIFNSGTLVGTVSGLTSASWSGTSIGKYNFQGLTSYSVAVSAQFGMSGPVATGSVTTGYVNVASMYSPVNCIAQGGVCNSSGAAVSYGNGTGLNAFIGADSNFTCNNGLVNGVVTNSNTNGYECVLLLKPPTGPSGFQFCGGEGGTCFTNNNADVYVAFGANGKFEYINASFSTPCSLASFGGIDPAPGVVKACFWAIPSTSIENSPGGGYAWCAQDGGSCTLFATAGQGLTYDAAYGTGSNYLYNQQPGAANGQTFQCGIAAFGSDPDPYVVKACFTKDIRLLPSGFSQLVDYGSTFVAPASGSVAYGANGAFVYQYYAAGQQGVCNEITFQTMVPNNLTANGACYFAPLSSFSTSGVTITAPVSAPAGTTVCADGEVANTCNFVGNATVYYGNSVHGNFYTKSFSGASNATYVVNCTPGTFGGDPDPGYHKSCYYARGTVSGSTATSAVQVNLAPVANVNSINSDGLSFTSGGLDGAVNGTGDTYSASLLNSAVGWNGQTFTMGAPNTMNGVSSTTVPLPFGVYSSISLLATGVSANQVSQTFTIQYTDGSTQTLTQSLSDWYAPQNYPGEAVALAMPYRNMSTGAQDARTFNLYGYTFALTPGKTVQSIQLPNNRHVIVMAITLGNTPVTPPAGPPNPPTGLSVNVCMHVENGLEFYKNEFTWSAPTSGSALTGYSITYHSATSPYGLITVQLGSVTSYTSPVNSAGDLSSGSYIVATNSVGSSSAASFPSAGSCTY